MNQHAPYRFHSCDDAPDPCNTCRIGNLERENFALRKKLRRHLIIHTALVVSVVGMVGFSTLRPQQVAAAQTGSGGASIGRCYAEAFGLDESFEATEPQDAEDIPITTCQMIFISIRVPREPSPEFAPTLEELYRPSGTGFNLRQPLACDPLHALEGLGGYRPLNCAWDDGPTMHN